MITIYGSDGTVKIQAPCDDNSTQEHELQGDNVLTLSFTLYEHVALTVGDYADFMGWRYWLMESYKPEQKSSAEWKYEIRLYGVESLLNRFLVLNGTDGGDEPVFTLTAPAAEHLGTIIESVNRGMDGSVILTTGEVVETDYIVIDYDGTYCGAALKTLAEKAGTKVEWWIDGRYVNLCRCEKGEEVVLGYGKGLMSLSCDRADNVKFYTRLYPKGSTKNIDPEKYGHQRLQLPCGATHVDVNVGKYGVWHKFEEAAFKDIYPRYIGTVSSVRSEERRNDAGSLFTVWFFKDDALPFDPNDYEIGGKVKRISFQEGSDLAGLGTEEDGTYYFEANYDGGAREWEIITVWPNGDGTQLPGTTLHPRPGDRYIPWNIRMPDEYYPLAEQEFKEAVDRYNDENAVDVGRYKGPTDHVYIEENSVDLYVGRRVRLESQKYFPDTGFRSSRITKITRKVNLPSQVDIEVCDAVSRRTMDAIADNVDEAKDYVRKAAGAFPRVLRTGDTENPTEYNVLSALRSLATFLRKDAPDVTEYLLRMMSGAEFGETLDSLIAGKGTLVTGDGRVQTDRLEVRGALTVLRLVVNEILGMQGDASFTETGMIEAVEDLGDDTYRLRIERRTAFEALMFREGNILYSIVNDLPTGGTSYYTSWMRVVSVNTTENTVTVVLYQDGDVPGGVNYAPQAGYYVTRRGDAAVPEAGGVNEDAQSWLISSREGRMMFLANVYKPVLEDWNYALVLGKLPKLAALEQIPVKEGDVGLMADVVVARQFYRFDGNGNVVTDTPDRGEWSLAVAEGEAPYRYVTHEMENPSTGYAYTVLEQHTVWHLGCKWGCLVDKTVKEPKWNSTDWVMLEGDPNYVLRIESTTGSLFRRSAVRTDLAAVVWYGNIDITDDVLATAGTEVEWLRDTGRPGDDAKWTADYVDGRLTTIRIDNSDGHGVGAGFGYEYREVTFTCRVFVPVGGGQAEKMMLEGTFPVR